jgi:hypothetical protein
MSRKVAELLLKLSLIDPTLPDFLVVSKEIAEAYKAHTKKKLENKHKPKIVKEKPKKTIMCDDCSNMLMNSVRPVLGFIKLQDDDLDI